MTSNCFVKVIVRTGRPVIKLFLALLVISGAISL